MADFTYWLELTLRQAAAEFAPAPVEPTAENEPVLELELSADEKLRLAEMHFLTALKSARAKVIEDGLHVLLTAHDRTIGDDPKFGLPLPRAA